MNNSPCRRHAAHKEQVEPMMIKERTLCGKRYTLPLATIHSSAILAPSKSTEKNFKAKNYAISRLKPRSTARHTICLDLKTLRSWHTDRTNGEEEVSGDKISRLKRNLSRYPTKNSKTNRYDLSQCYKSANKPNPLEEDNFEAREDTYLLEARNTLSQLTQSL